MAEPPEFWTFVGANLLVLLIGTGLTLLSSQAYRRLGKQSLAYATAGFALITVGAVVDAIYDFGLRGVGNPGGIYDVSARELLLLHAGQSVLLAVGLAILFVSLQRR